jgi:hypothetical protein
LPANAACSAGIGGKEIDGHPAVLKQISKTA